MVAIMGTSTCHVMNGDGAAPRCPACAASSTAASSRACGATRPARAASATSSAGSSSTGVPPAYHEARRGAGRLACTSYLTELAAAQAVGEHGLVALDWHSGNRSVLVDHELSGLVVGQTLATRPEDIYRALLEATAFGTRTIVETFDDVRRAGHRARRRRRPAEERAAHADLRRRHRPAAVHDRLRRRARRSARRSTPPSPPAPTPTSTPPPRRWAACDRGVYLPDPEPTSRPTTRSTPSTAPLHDYFGRGGNDVMHRLKAPPPRPRAAARRPDDAAGRGPRRRQPAARRRSRACTPS